MCQSVRKTTHVVLPVHGFSFFVHNGYMSGGASYVLSKEALRRLGEKGVGSLTPLCSLEETSEDVAMGQCMEVLGVSPIKTSDVFGRQSFLPFSLEYVLFDQGNCVKSNFSLNPMSAVSNQFKHECIKVT